MSLSSLSAFSSAWRLGIGLNHTLAQQTIEVWVELGDGVKEAEHPLGVRAEIAFEDLEEGPSARGRTPQARRGSTVESTLHSVVPRSVSPPYSSTTR